LSEKLFRACSLGFDTSSFELDALLFASSFELDALLFASSFELDVLLFASL
jgi:hypothetical protein